MCEYAEIENIVLSNGKSIKQINTEVKKEVECIYLEGWYKGISIPFRDSKATTITIDIPINGTNYTFTINCTR